MRGSPSSGTKTALEDYASSSLALFSIIQNTIMAPEVKLDVDYMDFSCYISSNSTRARPRN